MPAAKKPPAPKPAAKLAKTPAAVPAERGATIESIAQDIAIAIVEKRLPPGTWLREEALGRVYGVSRTKIRAALLTLSKDKLIEIVPDKGSFVSKPSVQEAREVFGVRRLLEAEVVRQFIARADAPDYQRLEQHIHIERSLLKASTTTGTVRERLLGDFHVVLAEACGNRTLLELVRELVARSSLIAMLYHSSNDSQCSSDEHGQLLRICQAGDAPAAVRAMTEHLSRIEANLDLDSPASGRQMDLVKALLA